VACSQLCRSTKVMHSLMTKLLRFTSAHRALAFTRYSFTSRVLRTNQPSFHSRRLSALPTLVQYCCTIIRQYKAPLPTSCLHAIHYAILVRTIPCKGQTGPRVNPGSRCQPQCLAFPCVYRSTFDEGEADRCIYIYIYIYVCMYSGGVDSPTPMSRP